MSYIISITQVGHEVGIKPRQWAVIDYDGPDNKHAIMGYTPEIETHVDIEREIYRQRVEKLDLSEVIVAVNQLVPMEHRPDAT